MKFASTDLIAWLIIVLFVAAAKAFSKMQSGSEPDEPPVVPRPTPTRQLPRAPRKLQTTDRQRVPARDIETLVEKLARKQAAKSAPPPPPVESTPLPEPAAAPSPAAPPPAPAEPVSPASVWAEALRDKQNLRNIIISAEIIGPPKALG